jgi:hypothetical protein
MASMPAATIALVVDAFDALGVPYFIGGSVASIIYGEPRFTEDVDFVVDLRVEQVPALVASLEARFYIDSEMILDALERHASFNVINLETMHKADVFVPERDEWFTSQMERRLARTLAPISPPTSVYLASAEDSVLQKLRWYELGGRVSDRQWRDITGVLKVQAAVIDLPYMHDWAARLGVTELLQQALEDAGLPSQAAE